MVKGAVNALGSLGDGHKFNEDLFAKAYKKVDKLGLGKILQPMISAMVTAYMVEKS